MRCNMIGVILWSDPGDRKAVIWCEDQGDLAFLSGTDEVTDSQAFFDAGDVVQFDMDLDCSVRRAHNPRLVVEKVGRALPDALRETAKPGFHASGSAEIIPFTPNPARQDVAARTTSWASGE